MTQYARPSSDVSVGGWSESAGASQTNIYTAIDEVVFSDADYIYSAAGSTDLCEIALGTITDPEVSSDHILSYRYTRNVTNKDVTLVFTLFSSAVQIATWTHANPSSDFALAQQTLVSSDADAITDYSALSVQIGVSVNGGNPASGWVSFMQFATPDASSPITINATAGTWIFTGVSGTVTPGAISVGANAGSFVWSTFSGSVVNAPPARIINAASGVSVWTGISGAVTPGAVSVTANAGTVIFAGASGAVTPGAITVTTGSGSFVWGTASALVSVGASSINATSGAIVWTGVSGSVTPGAVTVAASVGANAWAGASGLVTPGAVSVPASSSSIVFSGQSANVVSGLGVTVNANTGATVWTGVTASIVIVMTRAIITLSDAAVYVVSVEDGSP